MRARVSNDRGFTLVEVMVAISVLLVGVLGAATLVNGANRTTASTKAREAATNLGRDLTDAIHNVPWAYVTPASLAGQLQQQTGFGDSDGSTAGWQINRRGVSFTVSVTSCVVDDPSDGLAATHDSSFCAIAGSSSKVDSNPTDYKRATVTLTWTDQGSTKSLTQSTTVTSTYNGPAVTAVTPAFSSSQPYVYTASGTSLSFSATTDQSAAGADWLLNNNKQGAASGSGTSWSFTWNIGTPTGGVAGSSGCNPSANPQGTLDGTYFVGAQAYDSNTVSPGPNSATVTLNRCPPLAPTSFVAGKSIANGNQIEVQWDDNPEHDIAGYHVYRSTTNSNYQPVAQGSCSGLVTVSDCFDSSAPNGATTLYYQVAAVDRDSSGALRDGDRSTANWVSTNSPPTWSMSPSLYSGSAVGYPQYTIVWPNATASSGSSIDYYRVYRDSLANRWDVVDNPTPLGGGWLDPDPSGGPHTYWVTAVDTRGNESALSTPVTK